MSKVISTPAHTLYAETYAKKAARVREKAEAVNENALRDQLLDLARHYNFLAALAAPRPGAAEQGATAIAPETIP